MKVLAVRAYATISKVAIRTATSLLASIEFFVTWSVAITSYLTAPDSIGRCLIVLPFQGELAPSFRFPRAALRCALGFGIEAFQARLHEAYTLMVGAEPMAIAKPAARCPDWGGEPRVSGRWPVCHIKAAA